MAGDVPDLASLQEKLQGQHDADCVVDMYGLYLDICDFSDCAAHGCSKEVRDLFAGIGFEPAIITAIAKQRRRNSLCGFSAYGHCCVRFRRQRCDFHTRYLCGSPLRAARVCLRLSFGTINKDATSPWTGQSLACFRSRAELVPCRFHLFLYSLWICFADFLHSVQQGLMSRW